MSRPHPRYQRPHRQDRQALQHPSLRRNQPPRKEAPHSHRPPPKPKPQRPDRFDTTSTQARKTSILPKLVGAKLEWLAKVANFEPRKGQSAEDLKKQKLILFQKAAHDLKKQMAKEGLSQYETDRQMGVFYDCSVEKEPDIPALYEAYGLLVDPDDESDPGDDDEANYYHEEEYDLDDYAANQDGEPPDHSMMLVKETPFGQAPPETPRGPTALRTKPKA